jgi:hypothetical protein
MTNPVNATVGCLVVGEYLDEVDGPTDRAVHHGEAVRPTVVADYLDVWGRTDVLREFTVLLKDGQVVTVGGHALKSELPHASVFSIVVRAGDEEVVVALFKSDDVSGIFHGELRPDRKIA